MKERIKELEEGKLIEVEDKGLAKVCHTDKKDNVHFISKATLGNGVVVIAKYAIPLEKLNYKEGVIRGEPVIEFYLVPTDNHYDTESKRLKNLPPQYKITSKMRRKNFILCQGNIGMSRDSIDQTF